jgi:hypothetical protein
MSPVELHIYDFDMTLYESPQPPEPDPVWWFHAYPLYGFGAPGFDRRWILPLLVKARRSTQTPGVLTVLLTARADSAPLKQVIKKMIRTAGLGFNLVQLKPVDTTLSTPAYKAAVVHKLLKLHPSIRKVMFYDDIQANVNRVGAVVRRAGLAYVGVVVAPV